MASICRRLDGIALAIELAAPKVRVMSLPELSKRLDDRFGVLTGGSRAALPRHRTLRSLIDWSHELLSDAEKAVLRRASVFVGGWTLASAEQVCAGGEVDQADVLDLLTSLTDKSLFVAETQGDETRFGMLETVRHYAQDRLRESGEDAEVRGRHLGHFLDRVERLEEAPSAGAPGTAEPPGTGAREPACRARRVYRCARPRGGGPETRRQAPLVLGHAWRASEGRAWIARLMDRVPSDGQERAHATALHAAGALACMQGELTAAEAHYRSALALWERLGDRQQIVRSLGGPGNIAMERDDQPLGNEPTGKPWPWRGRSAIARASRWRCTRSACWPSTRGTSSRRSVPAGECLHHREAGPPEAHALVVLGMIRAVARLRGRGQDPAAGRSGRLSRLRGPTRSRRGVQGAGGRRLDDSGDLAKARCAARRSARHPPAAGRAAS